MSPPHPHSHDAPQPAPAWARRLALLLLIPAALLTAVGMLLLWPHDTPDPAAELDGQRRVFGTVAGVAPQPCPPAPADQDQLPGGPDAVCGTVTVTLTSSAQAGTQVNTDIPAGPGALHVGTGDDVVLLLLDQEDGGQG